MVQANCFGPLILLVMVIFKEGTQCLGSGKGPFVGLHCFGVQELRSRKSSSGRVAGSVKNGTNMKAAGGDAVRERFVRTATDREVRVCLPYPCV